jgi:phosphoserine phosphatase RsbU/P
VTECPSPSGDELGEDGLSAMLRAHAGLESPALLDALIEDLVQFHGGPNFPDDVSGIVFDFKGLRSS